MLFLFCFWFRALFFSISFLSFVVGWVFLFFVSCSRMNRRLFTLLVVWFSPIYQHCGDTSFHLMDTVSIRKSLVLFQWKKSATFALNLSWPMTSLIYPLYMLTRVRHLDEFIIIIASTRAFYSYEFIYSFVIATIQSIQFPFEIRRIARCVCVARLFSERVNGWFVCKNVCLLLLIPIVCVPTYYVISFKSKQQRRTASTNNTRLCSTCSLTYWSFAIFASQKPIKLLILSNKPNIELAIWKLNRNEFIHQCTLLIWYEYNNNNVKMRRWRRNKIKVIQLYQFTFFVVSEIE